MTSSQAGGAGERPRACASCSGWCSPATDLDVVPLYVETNPERGAAELAAELLAEALTGERRRTRPRCRRPTRRSARRSRASGSAPTLPGLPGRGGRPAAQRGDQRGPPGLVRHLLQRVPGQLLAPLDHGGLGDAAHPAGRRVRRSSCTAPRPRGFSHPVETISVETDEPETIERTLPLAPFIDGGWYWFDIVAGPRGTTLIEADWAALAEPGPAGPGQPRHHHVQPARLHAGHAAHAGRRDRGARPARRGLRRSTRAPDRVPTSRTSPTRPRSSATSCRSSSRATSAAPAASARSMDETVRAGRTATTCCSLDDDIKLDPEGILRARHVRRPGPQADDRRRAHVQPATTGRCCTRSPRPSRPASGGGERRRTPRPGTTSAAGTCGTPRGCTAAPTPTTTAGGCA